MEACDLRSENPTGKDLMWWLRMRNTPKGPNQMNFFYLIRTSHKDEIASLYRNGDDGKMSGNKDSWINYLVSFLKHIYTLEWHNSFEHLPEDGQEDDGYFLI